MFEQAFRNIDDVLWKEAGCATKLSSRWTRLFALILLAQHFSAPAGGQVLAKQGVEDPNRIQTFHSPMILEFPASEFIRPTSGSAWRFRGAERFDCDGVHFAHISLARSGKAKHGLTLQIEGALVVGPSFDRQAKVIVEILVDGRSIGLGSKDKIDAEERKTKPFRFSFRLTPEASAVLEKSNHTVVRVTLFVWEA